MITCRRHEPARRLLGLDLGLPLEFLHLRSSLSDCSEPSRCPQGKVNLFGDFHDGRACLEYLSLETRS